MSGCSHKKNKALLYGHLFLSPFGLLPSSSSSPFPVKLLSLSCWEDENIKKRQAASWWREAKFKGYET